MTRWLWAVLAGFLAVLSTVPEADAADGPAVFGEGASVAAPRQGSGSSSGGLIGVDELSGTAVASIPFALPSARGAVQPTLSLAYGSGRFGAAGLGWDLSIPSIERQPFSNGPDYDEDRINGNLGSQVDKFEIGGSRLRFICKVGSSGCQSLAPFPAWAVGWFYYRELVDSSHARYYWSPDTTRWRVEYSSGEVAEFGGPPENRDTEFYLSDPSAQWGTHRWNLRIRFESAHPENFVLYQWSKGEGRYLRGRLTDIYDTAPPGVVAPTNPDLPAPDTQSFAHHVHLAWDRVPFPFFHEQFQNPGEPFRAVPTTLLARVDVASAPFDGTGPRRLIRRYRLGYEDRGPMRTILKMVATQGARDGSGNVLVEGAGGEVPDVGGPGANPIRIEYTDDTHASGSPVLQSFAFASADVEGTAKNFTFADFNRDGIPDIARPRMARPNFQWDEDTVFYGHNSPSTRVTSYSDQSNGILLLENDLHHPPLSDCPVDDAALLAADSVSALGEFSGRNELIAYFRGSLSLCGFRWNVGQGHFEILPSAYYLPALNDFDLTGLVEDSDSDGLADLGTKVKNGITGPWIWTTTRSLGQVRVLTGEQSTIHDAGEQLADMDGDGIQDQIRLYQWDQGSSVHYLFWKPGDGRGYFYAWNATYGTRVDRTPQYVHDVDGDGLADLIYISPSGQSTSVGVELNNGDGRDFGGAGRTLSYLVPFSPEKLLFIDMNGSGTDDIVAMTTRELAYIDTMETSSRTTRALQLASIDNGRGRVSRVAYERSVVVDQKFGWQDHTPSPTDLVRSVVTESVGEAASSTAYFYHDPMFDGWTHRLRGFRRVRIRTTRGLEGSSPYHQHRETSYLSASCGADKLECPIERDPDADLLSRYVLPYMVEEYTDHENISTLDNVVPQSPTYGQTTAYHYDVGGAETETLERTAVDTWVYDWTVGGTASQINYSVVSGTMTDGRYEGRGVVDLQKPVNVRTSSSTRLRRRWEYDGNGNALTVVDDGRLGIDQPITTNIDWRVVQGSTWTWRPFSEITRRFAPESGDPHTFDRQQFYDYDTSGRLSLVAGALEGTLPLQRRHENAQKAVAPIPSGASYDGLVAIRRTAYDSFGNRERITDAQGGCIVWKYDDAFAQLPVLESTGACGGPSLDKLTIWDRGLVAPTRVESADGRVSEFVYDELGRLTDVAVADPQIPGLSVSAVHVDYFEATSGEVTTPARMHTVGPGVDTWSFLSGTERVTAQATRDGTQRWSVSGMVEAGAGELRKYDSWFQTADPAGGVVAVPEGTPYVRSVLGEDGGVHQVVERDGVVVLRSSHHGLVVENSDEAFNVARRFYDGHGRLVESRRTVGATEEVVQYKHGATGEVIRTKAFRLSDPSNVLTRWFAYDSFGRLVENGDPSTSIGFAPQGTPGFFGWRYAYDFDGKLVGTSDARGCGKNLFYDAIGRPLAEDWSPCKDTQDDYTSVDLTSGDGSEVFERYDAPEQGQATPAGSQIFRGHLVAVSDLGAWSRFTYDGRGRPAVVERRIAKPGAPSGVLSSRYSAHVFRKTTAYDLADRLLVESTGADVVDLLGANQESTVSYAYNQRGLLASLSSSYADKDGAFEVIRDITYDAEGRVVHRTFGDRARTEDVVSYDQRGRVDTRRVSRGSPSSWAWASGQYAPPTPGSPSTLQTILLADTFSYDSSGDISAIADGRVPLEWPAGAQPVSRLLQHDDLHRLTRVDYGYPSGSDVQVSPYEAEESAGLGTAIPRQLIGTRVQWQTYTFGPDGRLTNTDDDVHAHWDRSLGAVGYNSTRPFAVTDAGGGVVRLSYDESGNATDLLIDRGGSCSAGPGKCVQVLHYDWNPDGSLSRARRWDLASAPSAFPSSPPSGAASSDQHYLYSMGDRVVRAAADGSYTVTIFASLRLEGAHWDGVDYERTAATEVASLGGVGRVVHDSSLPGFDSNSINHVFVTISDQLGSGAAVVDRSTGELVERTSYQLYGAVDADYRPSRWSSYRDPFKFTGQELDADVGLEYFGARYYLVNAGRWLSPDPVATHMGLVASDPYAYVEGRADSTIDVAGLCSYDEKYNDPCVASGPSDVQKEDDQRRKNQWDGPLSTTNPPAGNGVRYPSPVPPIDTCGAHCRDPRGVVNFPKIDPRMVFEFLLMAIGPGNPDPGSRKFLAGVSVAGGIGAAAILAATVVFAAPIVVAAVGPEAAMGGGGAGLTGALKTLTDEIEDASLNFAIQSPNVTSAIVATGEALTESAPSMSAELSTASTAAKVVADDAPTITVNQLSRVQANKIAGDAARDELVNALEAAFPNHTFETEVYFWTPFGARFVDILVRDAGKIIGGLEVKSGASRYYLIQELKDLYLRVMQDGFPTRLVRVP